MERRREQFLRGLEKTVSLGYKLTALNPQHLDILNERADDPSVIYFNHSAQDDPLITVTFLQKYIPKRLQNVVMPISSHHLQFKNFPAYSLLVGFGKNYLGFSMPDVVQSYRRRGTSKQDTSETALARDLRFAHILKASMAEGCIVLISPEGHRSESGTLLPAEGGVGAIARLMKGLKDKGKIKNGYFIPMGLIFENHKHTKLNYNPIKPPSLTISIGTSMSIEMVLEESAKIQPFGSIATSHFLMEKLAALLPQDMRGVYAPHIIGDTYSGRFEQRMDGSGRVYIFDKKENKKTEGSQ